MMKQEKKGSARWRLLRNALIVQVVHVDKLPIGNAARDACLTMAHTKLILKDAVENKVSEAQILEFEMSLS
jgi:hypothetical protein